MCSGYLQFENASCDAKRRGVMQCSHTCSSQTNIISTRYRPAVLYYPHSTIQLCRCLNPSINHPSNRTPKTGFFFGFRQHITPYYIKTSLPFISTNVKVLSAYPALVYIALNRGAQHTLTHSIVLNDHHQSFPSEELFSFSRETCG